MKNFLGIYRNGSICHEGSCFDWQPARTRKHNSYIEKVPGNSHQEKWKRCGFLRNMEDGDSRRNYKMYSTRVRQKSQAGIQSCVLAPEISAAAKIDA